MRKITKIREDIDLIDEEIVNLLTKRLALIPEIIEYKKKNNLETYQPKREEEILNKKAELGKKQELREEYVKDIFKRIIEESHYLQNKK